MISRNAKHLMGTDVLTVEGLSVSYGKRGKASPALRDLSLSLVPGSVLALLGPNGAGKSTLMRCITGQVKPAAGRVRAFGKEVSGLSAGGREHLRLIGVVPENSGVYGKLTAREYLEYFGGFYGISDLRDRVDSLCRAMHFESGDKPVGKLSQGNRQKLQLIRSLLHRPQLLLWDEPTEHLDPLAQKEVLAYLREYLRETGASLLLTSHRLEQVEGLATDFGFLRAGRLLFSGDRHATFLETGGEVYLEIEILEDADLASVQTLLHPFGLRLEKRPPDNPLAACCFRAEGAELESKMSLVLSRMTEGGHAVCRVEMCRPDLADIYARFIGGEVAEE